jgi:hypothetical protein
MPITMGSGPGQGRNHLESLCPRLRVKAIEPGLVDLGDDSEADLLVAHEVAELVAVDEVDGRCRERGGLAGGGRESGKGLTSTARSAPAAAPRWNKATISRPTVAVGS